jgi:hypothetical protein
MENSFVDINQLTPEQLKKLQHQLEEKQKLERERVNAERAKYKELVDITTRALFPVLKNASAKLSEAKSFVFKELATLIKMKEELYNRDSDQNTHSFSNEDGTITITVGYNIVDSWDDTVGTGITKVHDYIQTLIKDDNSKVLVDTVMDLLSQDAKQNLKASRVLKLRKMADKSGNKDFIDAIQIIQDAYKPVRTKEFVRAEFKGEHGEKLLLPLSITDAPFAELEDSTLINTQHKTTA